MTRIATFPKIRNHYDIAIISAINFDARLDEDEASAASFESATNTVIDLRHV